MRIRSEHAIGYLKGRFQLLKGLRVAIVDKASHKFATYWVLACIAVHNFALDREQEDHGNVDMLQSDPFMEAEEDSDSSEDLDVHERRVEQTVVQTRSRRLRAAKVRREDLKRVMLRASGWDLDGDDGAESEE